MLQITECYKYWIALTDCDGFRIDTVKHMALEEARNFCGAIRDFADTIGKRNFPLVGEIAGGDFFQDFVLDNLAVLQRNLSAALEIGGARTTLHSVAKGLAPGRQYFESFREQREGFESHRSFGDHHVSILDDHDHVIGSKVRFSAEIPDDSPVKDYHAVAATAVQLFTLGIPCIYYGTEQAFAGPAHSQLPFVLAEGWNDASNHGDRYLREALRIGRQYLRQIRLPHTPFEFPPAGELVAWSRLLDNQEAVCIVNPNGVAARGGDVVVSAELWQAGTEFTVVANTAQAAAGSGAFTGTHPVGSHVRVKGRSHPGEPAFIEIRDVPPAEVLVLIKTF